MGGADDTIRKWAACPELDTDAEAVIYDSEEEARGWLRSNGVQGWLEDPLPVISLSACEGPHFLGKPFIDWRTKIAPPLEGPTTVERMVEEATRELRDQTSWPAYYLDKDWDFDAIEAAVWRLQGHDYAGQIFPSIGELVRQAIGDFDTMIRKRHGAMSGLAVGYFYQSFQLHRHVNKFSKEIAATETARSHHYSSSDCDHAKWTLRRWVGTYGRGAMAETDSWEDPSSRAHESEDAPREVSSPNTQTAGFAPIHPSVGGKSWSADMELGAKVHELLGDYLPRIAPCSPEERHRLLVELAGRLYDLHASKRIKLVRPGHVEDCSQFDDGHTIRAHMAVWQPLNAIELDDIERRTIERALAGARSRWLKEAMQKAIPGDIGTVTANANKVTAKAQAREWAEIEICFLSDERVEVRIGGQTETRNYAEMGFASKKNETPVLAWETLRALAKTGGKAQIASDSRKWAEVEKRIQEIRRTFRAQFGLPDDPLPFVKKTRKNPDDFGYRAKFKISCHRSYDS